MATRESATFDANSKRMKRNAEKIKSDRGTGGFSELEPLKRIPSGSSAKKQWRPSGRKSGGRS